MDPFRVEQTLAEQSEVLLPLDRELPGLYGNATLLELPRAVTVVTPEAMRLLGVESFDDLSMTGAGTERVNFFGIAGTPFIRGVLAGTYFNGMLRAFQRNEMPTSFGSLEALDIVRGPAPAHLTPTLVGGFVNMIPKSPFFDEPRGRVNVTLGRWDHFRVQADYGGPTRVGDIPTAWRLSITAQDSDSYYEHVHNDFISLYGALKMRLDEKTSIFTGAEYYDFKSSEAPGWNRPTQQLVDSGRYVIGEPINVADPAWQGTANRDLASFYGVQARNGIEDFNALVVPAAVVEKALAEGRITQAAVDAMLDLSDPDDLARAYGQPLPSTGLRDPRFDASNAPGWLDETLAALMSNPNDGYRYTRDYFEQGGEVFTEEIDGSRVLAAEEDYANSEDFIWFFDWVRDGGKGESIKNQIFVESLKTRKFSTYGFSLFSDQFVLADKLSIEKPVDALNMKLTYGADLRYSWAKMRQDFFAEPFSRRDLTRDGASPNSVVLTGPQIAPDGLNLWSPGLGANEESELYQAALFALADVQHTERLRIFYSLRGEWANWDTKLPDVVQRRALADEIANAGSITFLNGSISPVISITRNVNIYGAVQAGKAMGPGDGGTISGESSFTDIELYEVGTKAALLDNKLFIGIAGYVWEQSVYSEIDARSFPLRGKGIEFEAIYSPSDRFSLMASFDAQEVRILSTELGYGTVPKTEQDWALTGGIMDARFDRPTPNNPDDIYAGYPQVSAKLFASYDVGYGFRIAGGPHWRDAFWASHDRTLRLPSSFVWNALLTWNRGPWTFSLRVENLTNEDHYLASDPVFSANTLVTKARPRSWELSAAYEF